LQERQGLSAVDEGGTEESERVCRRVRVCQYLRKEEERKDREFVGETKCVNR
jgi:hypothetical protein